MIEKYTIYGERCSGTNFLQKTFSQLTPIPITWEFGWKHWFGYKDREIIQNGGNTLFLCIVRNPYQWLMSFSKKRHHIEPKQNINIFRDEIYSVNQKRVASGRITYEEIMEDRNRVNGERYKNIYELRKHKCRYLWWELPLFAEHNYFIHYEDLLTNNEYYLRRIISEFDLPLRKNPLVSATRPGQKHLISREMLHEINDNIDWQTENKIGYHNLGVIENPYFFNKKSV